MLILSTGEFEEINFLMSTISFPAVFFNFFCKIFVLLITINPYLLGIFDWAETTLYPPKLDIKIIAAIFMQYSKLSETCSSYNKL